MHCISLPILFQVVSSGSQEVKDVGLKHGDILYLRLVEGPSTSKAAVSASWKGFVADDY